MGMSLVSCFFLRHSVYQANYLKIYPTDLRQNFSFGSTMHIDDQFKISFSIHQDTLHGNQFLLALSAKVVSDNVW